MPNFDSAAGGSQGTLSTLTIAGVVANNSNRYLGVCVSYLTFGATLNTVKWNGTSLTKQNGFETRAGASNLEYWDLLNPANGSFNLVCTFSAATDSEGGLWSLYNVNLENPRRKLVQATGTSTAPSATITGTTGDILLSATGWAGGAVNTPDATWTSDWNPPALIDPNSAGSHTNGGASVTRTDSLASSVEWGMQIVSIQGPVSAGIYYTKA